jgi:mannobiose 2-epimerase
MWDKAFGGFYWEVDFAGRAAAISEKRMYGQAFGLYALAEYAIATGDVAAKTQAKELFTLMETKAHDNEHGGYRENLLRDWSTAPRRLNPASKIKRMNTHMHLLEAMTRWFALIGEPLIRDRLVELIMINSNSVVRKNIGGCTDQYLENWEPMRGSNYARVSYGHDVENISLLIEACRTVGISVSLLLDLHRTIFNYALQYGHDEENGGFYDSGPLNKQADRREKIWWVQAECLISALRMFHLTREEVYRNCFLRTLGWIVNGQVDWEHGEWHERVSRDGKISGVKSGPWKGPYHNGRAMLQCLELLPR